MTGWKGTPGPWKVHGSAIVAPSGEICSTPDFNGGDGKEQLLADRKGIAAVPQLVEALEWIVTIATANLEQDDKLRTQGARTLNRIADRAEEALKAAGVEL